MDIMVRERLRILTSMHLVLLLAVVVPIRRVLLCVETKNVLPYVCVRLAMELPSSSTSSARHVSSN